MKFKFLNVALASLAIAVGSFPAHSGIIDASSVLLDDAGATQLESWLGQGDLDWDSIWYGTTGATPQQWHDGVDGVLDTVSIMKVIDTTGVVSLLGGYTDIAWDADGTYSKTDNAFIFNLTNNSRQLVNTLNANVAIVTLDSYFPTFGGGHNLTGGYAHAIGVNGAGTHSAGYANNASAYYNGNVNILGGAGLSQFKLLELETVTFAQATDVPEPSTLAIFALGMIGLASRRFKKQS
ncbi:PEP_CTERM-anchored TLD domain-containing protein [Colwellia sp. MB3u-70]|uniref:PEP_CTERM-anchored TLD domain-containing protein n=1 Tax=unclassified Colwellia TaxID=196834 RepID=UPI0015F40382|nr:MULTISPECIES: PEP_CTERM-anchored TLD domain-containing protein [unclassified Colwellia]MBA6293637.1 PEP_CTERM-anchored TLD domain-containing protein [Colwellia sp. MB3u-8]MBA6308936.1 PEP_CTERM-anchored TLD domain-containing protein [Colwellia sp. MB3u-70]